MGWKSTFAVQVVGDEAQTVIAAIRECGDGKYAIEADGSARLDFTWASHPEELLAVSAKFPQAKIFLSVQGEDAHCVIKMYLGGQERDDCSLYEQQDLASFRARQPEYIPVDFLCVDDVEEAA